MKAQFEKVTSSEGSSFKFFKYESNKFKAPWHFHPEYELCYIKQGRGIRYVGHSIEDFSEDELVLIGSNLPHCWKTAQDYQGTSISIIMQWDKDVLGDNWLDKEEFVQIRNLLKKASTGLKFSADTTNKVRPILEKEVENKPFGKIITLLQILQILTEAEEYDRLSVDGYKGILSTEAGDRINLLYNYVEENYKKKITLNEVSSMVSMSEEAFCRFFKRVLNKPFFTFINEYRINIACKLLIESELQVSEIAYQSGYESLPFFYRQFQKFKDTSPLAYRKMYRRIEA